MIEKRGFWFSDKLEMRSGQGGKSLASVSGPVVRYDDSFQVGAFKERIAPGAFSWTDVSVFLQHDHKRLVGRTGANLDLADGDRELRADLRLVETRDSHDARTMLDEGMLVGWSAEFVVKDDDFDGMNRTIKRADLHGISLVDQPAYKQSLAEIEHRYKYLETRAAGVNAQYKYGQTETVSDTGRNRKRRIRPNAFKTSLDDPDQEITLQLGRDPGKTIGSKKSGTLELEDTDEGLTAIVREAPDTTAYADFQAQLRAGMVAHLVPQVREVDGAYRDIPEPGNESVSIREYSSLKLYALALQLREPKGADSVVELLEEGRSLWAGLEVY